MFLFTFHLIPLEPPTNVSPSSLLPSSSPPEITAALLRSLEPATLTFRGLFRAEEPPAALPGAPAAAPAPRGDTHAPLGRRPRSALPLHLALALRALGPSRLVGGNRARAPRLLGDGAKDVIAFAQEVAGGGAQAEAALAQDHAGAGGLGGTGPLVVLQLGQVGRVAVGDELEETTARSVRLRHLRATVGPSPYLALVLHLLGGSPHYVDVRRGQADRQVHRDVLGGAVGSEDPHVGLIKERGQL